ncbi:serine hydrolase domain-containing protein [Paenibacillus flagellatus]|uniref:Serine hydrolase n=1 Tax=Paenibacillus flagellatus TaxID=2211139 RepID=A0A2V5KDT0_9BACL|nr:serine hydrolase domain-containing protein [Paenibacillus flagellatus]PYI57142.1 serine hydrolase [Paenibacillus flagellatus]
MNEYDTSAAADANMDPDRIADAFRLLDEAVARGDTPGGVAAIGRHGRVAAVHAVGVAHTAAPDGGRLPAAPGTIYDCASLTKVVATLPLALLLVDRGRLRLDDPVAVYLPAFAAEGKSAVTVKQLLTHTSGLLSHKDMYSHGWTPDEVKAHVLGQPLEYEPGTKMVYSDLGFITLGAIVSELFGEPLADAARKHVFEPLGMSDTRFLPREELRPRIAATEYDAGLGRHKWGEVHDENAGALGGASGHAGLFSTAADLAKYAAMWLAQGRIGGSGRLLSAAAVEAATRCATPGLAANRGLGWVLKGDPWDASGDLLSPSCYGHTGFTGTSLWMDPAADCFAVLLTNRVHYGRDVSVARLRHCFHNATAAACL